MFPRQPNLINTDHFDFTAVVPNHNYFITSKVNAINIPSSCTPYVINESGLEKMFAGGCGLLAA